MTARDGRRLPPALRSNRQPLRPPHGLPPWLRPVLGIVLSLSVLELLLRALGLGHPPLLVEDRQMEYRFRPNQSLRRFGHPIQINQWGMRSPAVAAKPAAGQRRVLVLADSITWGGAETDQERIAVSRLQRRLGPSWELLNLATPSWGPANWLGAVRRFGVFGAPRVLLVISSHDAEDDPTYAPLAHNPETPTQDPLLALIELWQRYLAPRLARVLPGAAPQQAAVSPNLSAGGPAVSPGRRPPDLLAPLPALAELVRTLRSRGIQLVVLQHWERGEIETARPYPNHDRISGVLRDQGITTIQAGPIMAACAAAHGQPVAALFVDQVHPYTDLGQRCLAEAMGQALLAFAPPAAAASARP